MNTIMSTFCIDGSKNGFAIFLPGQLVFLKLFWIQIEIRSLLNSPQETQTIEFSLLGDNSREYFHPCSFAKRCGSPMATIDE